MSCADKERLLAHEDEDLSVSLDSSGPEVNEKHREPRVVFNRSLGYAVLLHTALILAYVAFVTLMLLPKNQTSSKVYCNFPLLLHISACVSSS
jgi:hypothetical protein